MAVFESWLQAVTENVQFCYEKSEVQSLRMKSVQLCVIEEVTYNNSALLSDFFTIAITVSFLFWWSYMCAAKSEHRSREPFHLRQEIV